MSVPQGEGVKVREEGLTLWCSYGAEGKRRGDLEQAHAGEHGWGGKGPRGPNSGYKIVRGGGLVAQF